VRCTRCDKIAVPQAVGRTPGGVLVFGWCLDCLHDANCRIEDEPAPKVLLDRPSPPSGGPKPIGRLGRPWRLGSRRLLGLGVAGLLALWALILVFLGLLKLPGARPVRPRPLGTGPGWVLTAGGAAMALASLGVWIGVLHRAVRLRFLLKVVQVAAATVAFTTLGWGVVNYVPGRIPAIVAIVATALGVSWAAYWLERRRPGPRRQARTAAL
jgi:hypothetical protein